MEKEVEDMVQQKQRRRPMSREEALARQERLRLRKEKEQESRELARGPIDLPFCLLVLLLTAIGLVMLLSASFPSAYYETKSKDPMYYFVRQGIFAVMGIAAMFLISKINYQWFRKFARPLLYLSVVLLILVAIPGIGIMRNNARRWLGFGDLFTFQPSEIAKLAVVLYFSDSISKKKDRMRTTRYGILPYLMILGVLAVLMMLEPHLSGTVLILSTGAALMLVGGINWAWIGAAVGFVGGVAALMLTGVISYGQSRIAMWQNPFIDARGKGYQLSQSLISIGSGGLLGVGLGKSRQKFLYLPEEHNDFIFAIICEELGLIGASIIMLLFAALFLVLLDCPPRPGPLRLPAGGGRHYPDRHADVFEHRRGDGPAAHYGHLPAVFQLRRYGAVHTAGGDGDRIVGFKADEANKGRVVCQGGASSPLRIRHHQSADR